MAPAVALGAPQQIRLGCVAHDDDRVDARRRRDQRRGNRRADAACFGGRQPGNAFECATHAAHDIGALERDLGGDRGARALKNGGGLGVRQRERADRLLDGSDGDLGGHVAVECGIRIRLLEGDDLRIAIATIGGDDDSRAGVVDAVRQSLVAEAAEHGRVDDADALAGFGPVHLLGNIRHVDRDAIAGLEPELTQRERAARNLEQQLLARDAVRDDRAAATAVRRLIPAITFEPQRGFAAASRQHMAVHFVEAGVGQCATEPAIERRLAAIQSRAPGGVVRGERRCDRFAAARVEALPARLFGVPGQPGAVDAERRLEPVQLAARDVAVIGAWIFETGAPRFIPGLASGEGIDARGGRLDDRQCGVE